MRIPVAFIALLLTVEAFSQQSAKPHPAVLLHGDHPPTLAETTGAIHGVVVSPKGQPVNGVLVTAYWVCTESCFIVMSSTTTNEAGEYLFEPVTLGEYAVYVGLGPLPVDFGPPPRFAATPLTDYRVGLSADHPQAEVRFELSEYVPPKKDK